MWIPLFFVAILFCGYESMPDVDWSNDSSDTAYMATFIMSTTNFMQALRTIPIDKSYESNKSFENRFH